MSSPPPMASAAAMLLATAGFSACLNNRQKSSLLARRPHPQLRLHICNSRNRGAMLPESFSRPSLGGGLPSDAAMYEIKCSCVSILPSTALHLPGTAKVL